MSIVDWFVDIVEGFFIQSDLYDVEMSDAELCERNSFDSLCENSVQNYDHKDVPIGKQVL